MQVSPVNTEARGYTRSLELETRDFLRLLVAELQHQDPLKPLGEAEFISQAAQFSELDEIKRGNTLLERMAGGGQDLFKATALIVLYARAETARGPVEGEITALIAGDAGMLVEVCGQRVPVNALLAIWKEGS